VLAGVCAGAVDGGAVDGAGVCAKRGEVVRIVPIKTIVRFFKIEPPSKLSLKFFHLCCPVAL
jgi:hypothetical protein